MRISPGPTARVSATLTALRVRVEAAWPTGLGCWTLASPPQLHFGVFYSEGSHTIQPCLASTQKGPIYCRELGMGNMHPNASHSSLWIMGIQKEGHNSILTSREHRQSLPAGSSL